MIQYLSQQTAQSIMNNRLSHAPPTFFDLYKVIIREVHGEAHNTANSVKDVHVWINDDLVEVEPCRTVSDQ